MSPSEQKKRVGSGEEFCDKHVRPKIPSATGAKCPECMGENGLTTDELMAMLKNKRRRYAVRVLMEKESTVLTILRDEIASMENGVKEPQLTSQQRKRVYIAMYQTHLPKMDDLGIVDFEKRENTIERGENFWEAAGLLTALELAGVSVWGIILQRAKAWMKNKKLALKRKTLGLFLEGSV